MDEPTTSRSALSLTVGAFVLAATGACVYLAREPLGRLGTPETTRQVTVLLDRTGGLDVGSPVTLAGHRIGTVSEIEPPRRGDDPPRFRARLRLTGHPELLHWLQRDSQVTVVADNILGDKRVDFTMGTGGEELLSGGEVIGAPPQDIASLVAELRGAASDIRRMSARLEQFADDNHLDGQTAAETLATLRESAENIRVISQKTRTVMEAPGRAWEAIQFWK